MLDYIAESESSKYITQFETFNIFLINVRLCRPSLELVAILNYIVSWFHETDAFLMAAESKQDLYLFYVKVLILL